MKKKLLSLFLCAVMLSSGLLTGCSSKSGDDETADATADTETSSRLPMTLSLWLPTSENTTEEAIKQVENAINVLTQAKYDTAIELHLIPKDEYQDAIDARMSEIEQKIADEEAEEESRRQEAKALKQAGVKAETESETEETESQTEEETILNEYGFPVTKYPDVEEKQMDIFLVQGYDNYARYIEGEKLQQLDGELSTTSKLLKTYIFPMFLTLANQKGTYGIPNNHPVGEYQYLLVNKELVEKYDYDPDELTSLLKCEHFVTDIGNQNLSDVVPMLDWYDAYGMKYWSEDGSWSILASQVANNMTYNTKCMPKSVFSIPVYTSTLIMMKKLDELGYVGDGTLKEGQKFAVGIVKGDGSIVEQYEDEYYVNIYAKPVMDGDDVFGNMFAVSTYSKNLARSMEIITYLNTSSDIRTILQYGVEGIHWQKDPDNSNTIMTLSKDYQMDLLTTGNVYMTYPEPGKTMDDWAYAKQQNIDSIVTPYLTFGETDFITEKNADMVKQIAEMSKEYKERVDKMTGLELEDNIMSFKKELKFNDVFQAASNVLDEAYGPAKVYVDYYSNQYAG